jgi:hypothetical protein
MLSAPDPLHVENEVWDPAADADRLLPFLPTPEGPVGVGWATHERLVYVSGDAATIPLRLSTFTTAEVSVTYTATTNEGPLGGGIVTFLPGETVQQIQVAVPDDAMATVTLTDATNAVVTDTGSVLLVGSTTLLPRGSDWLYLDTGVSQGTAWRLLGFDDSGWQEGPAELGFGDGGEATTIDGGPSGDRHRTTYFRKRIEVSDHSLFGTLLVKLVRDDGAIVYINGQEVFRSNMPAGTVSYATWAVDAAVDEGESTFFTKEVPATALVSGTNIVAVEVHQATATSSDLSFDLELVALPVIAGSGMFVRGDVNADGTVDLSDPVAVLLHLFLQDPRVECLKAADANDDGSVDLADPVYLLQHLFAGGAAAPAPRLACGPDETPDDLSCDGFPLCAR